MAQKLTASIPQDMHLDANYIIRFTAIDASDGSTVTSVVISEAGLLVTNLSQSPDSALESGPFQLIPLSELP